MQKFKEVTLGSARLTRRHVIILAHFFGVSREALVRRLEELVLVKGGPGTGFKPTAALPTSRHSQVLGDLAAPDLRGRKRTARRRCD